MRRWAFVIGTLGAVSTLASCSGAPTQSGENTSSVSQADSPSPVATQWTARTCQLIGDFDYAARPGVVATESMTYTRFGIRGTDEGSAIVDPDDGKIFFYFGDTNPDGLGYGIAPNPWTRS